ncbi:MAG: hypothetical protein AABX51_03115 [Nanoarchaeota archaeon]
MTTNEQVRDFVNTLSGDIGEFLDKLPEPKCEKPMIIRERLLDPDYQNNNQAWNLYIMRKEGDYFRPPWLES